MKTFEYRMRPTKKQEHALMNVLIASRKMYNACLEELITHYKETGTYLHLYEQDKRHGKREHPDLPAVVVDTTLKRLHRSFTNFFRGLKEGRKVGFPRFKGSNAWNTTQLRDATNCLDNGRFKVVLQKRKLICYSRKKRAKEVPSMSKQSQHPFKWRHFQADIILLCVRWYLRYALSYRDLEEIMLERGLSVDHTTIYRWVQQYAPELEQRCRSHMKSTTDSWRVDETYIKGATRTWSLTLSEAKEVSSLVGFRLSPKSLMATGVAFE